MASLPADHPRACYHCKSRNVKAISESGDAWECGDCCERTMGLAWGDRPYFLPPRDFAKWMQSGPSSPGEATLAVSSHEIFISFEQPLKRSAETAIMDDIAKVSQGSGTAISDRDASGLATRIVLLPSGGGFTERFCKYFAARAREILARDHFDVSRL